MSRAHLYRALTDTHGEVLTTATVRFLEPGTSTLASGIEDYSGDAISDPIVVTNGVVNIYAEDQTRVDIEVTRSGQTTLYRDLDLLSPTAASAPTAPSLFPTYNKFTYASIQRSSVFTSPSGSAIISMPSNDSSNVNSGSQAFPGGTSPHVTGGNQDGIIIPPGKFCFVQFYVSLDTSGPAGQIAFEDTMSNDSLFVQALDPAINDQPHRIARWSGVVGAPESATGQVQYVRVRSLTTGLKINFAQIWAYPY